MSAKKLRTTIGLLPVLTAMTTIGALVSNASLTLYYVLPDFSVGEAATYVNPTVGDAYPGASTTFTVAAGSLPTGLSLDSSTGEITGTPTTAGAYSFSITASNNGETATQSFSTTVLSASTETSRSLLAAGNQARMQRFIEKCRSGDTVKIAAIGGSITQGSGASTTSKCYVSLFNTWVKSNFSCSTTLYNKGIGATSSDYGVFRAYRDIVSNEPDLVIVEFAVNDGSSGESTYGEPFEGLLRQLLKASSKPAVIVLFMTQTAYQGGQAWQSLIAANYDLPMVSYQNAVWPELQDGTIVSSDISSDGTHPNDAGHALVASFLEDLVSRAADAFPTGSTESDIPKVAVALKSTTFEFTNLYDGDDTDTSDLESIMTSQSGWTFTNADKDGDYQTVGAAYQSSTAGSTIDFAVEDGDIIYVSYEMANDGDYGEAEFTVDDSTSTTIDANFTTSGWGDYRAMASIGSMSSSGAHTIEATILSDTTGTGHYFRILGIGTADSTKSSAPDWADADASSNHWFSSWFGDFYYDETFFDNWIYSGIGGWEYFWPTSESGSAILWDYSMKVWLWTADGTYPIFYDLNNSDWLYYVGGTCPYRWFWSYSKNEFVNETSY